METLRDKIRVAVIGAGQCDEEIARRAREVGGELARRGAILVGGGLGGVMEAACRGAKEAGGTTVGILPGERAEEANPWVDLPIPTGMGIGRNVLVVRSADAVIAVGGGYGTLAEIAIALKSGLPVVGLGTWKLKRSPEDKEEHVVVAGTPVEAVKKALALAAGRRKKR